MLSQRGITTDQLANILQVIQLGRKSGRLTVERVADSQHEEGEIFFSHGQIVSARCGSLHGQVAFRQLNMWGACRFVFVDTTMQQDTDPKTESYSKPDKSTGPLVQRKNSSQLQPLPTATESARIPLPSAEGREPAYRASSPLPSIYPCRLTTPAEGLAIIEKARLSRLHRHLFLLIDGNRSTQEIIRLMGRTPTEVQHLLSDLERVGIILAR